MIDTHNFDLKVREALAMSQFGEDLIQARTEVKSHFDKVTTEMQEVTCLTCDTIIKKNEEFPEHPIHQSMIDAGNINTFSCGFGSRYDMNIYIIGICDDCLEKFIKQQKALKI